MLIVTPIVGFYSSSLLRCALLFCNHRDWEERAGCLTLLSSWCLVTFVWLFLTMPRVSLQLVIEVFPDQIHLLFLYGILIFTNKGPAIQTPESKSRLIDHEKF